LNRAADLEDSREPPHLVRERVALHELRANNELAGFKFATVGVLCAVLPAFAVWEKLNGAESNVAIKAGARDDSLPAGRRNGSGSGGCPSGGDDELSRVCDK
jgi:hypothetical protein